jgi:xylose dehydrogenase (NAD/NADP)
MDVQALVAGFGERDWLPEGAAPEVEPVRLAVVGLGGFAAGRALPAIEAAEFCEVGLLVSGDPAKAERLAGEYGAADATYESFHDGNSTDAYDAVYVCTPNATHLEHVEAAAAQGKPVLCEKPLEATAERAESLVAACEAAGVPLMTAYRLQADPEIRLVRRLVRAGAVGEPVKATGEFSVDILAGDRSPDQWRLDPDLAGGGALMDLGVYPLNTARFVLDRDPRSVHGYTSAPDPAFEGVDQNVTFTADFGDGVTGAFTANFRAHIEDTLQVLGTEGQIRVDNAFGSETDRPLHVETGGGTVDVEPPLVNEIVAEFDYFAHRLRSGEPIEPDGADGLTDVRATAAVYEAAETGRRVDLDDVGGG